MTDQVIDFLKNDDTVAKYRTLAINEIVDFDSDKDNDNDFGHCTDET